MRAPRPAVRDDAGMSLVEVLIALVLIGIVFAAMTAALINGLTSVQRANGQVAANQLANEQVEQLRNRLFTAVAPAGAATSVTVTEPAVVRLGNTYTITWTSTWVDSACNNASTSPRDFLRLQVVVSWRHRDGSTKQVQVETFRAPTPRDGTSFTPVRVDTLTC